MLCLPPKPLVRRSRPAPPTAEWAALSESRRAHHPGFHLGRSPDRLRLSVSCSIQKRNAVCVQKRNSTAGQVLGIQAAAKFGFAGFFALELAPAGACRAAEAARPAVCQAPDGAWVASPQSPILRRSDSIFVPSPGTDNKKQPTGLIIPLLTAQTFPLLIAPPHGYAFQLPEGPILTS